jgi:CheY-like chemotaxis protein
MIDADASQIDQVWMNLAANARDAMPSGGKFTFHVDAREDGVHVTVRDSGVGMSSETAQHIFEPFFTTKPRGKGTGLGLSIVRGIVEQHGGRIEMESALGQGATFRLWFPHSAQAAVRETLPTPNTDGGHDGRRVLVVDDDESIRTLVVTLLNDAGYQVHAAGSEHELRELLDQIEALDLLLSDVILPDTDGPKVRQIVSERYPGAPCLFMTGHADGLLAPRGVLRREVDLLRKPFSGDQLLAKVEEMLQRKARAERRAAAASHAEVV